VSPETIEAVARVAAEHEEIARVVLLERRVEPRSEPAFTDTEIVVVLVDPPNDPPPREFAAGLFGPIREVLGDVESLRFTIPSARGVEASTRGGTVVYERSAS
jgi:hypothetical protein